MGVLVQEVSRFAGLVFMSLLIPEVISQVMEAESFQLWNTSGPAVTRSWAIPLCWRAAWQFPGRQGGSPTTSWGVWEGPGKLGRNWVWEYLPSARHWKYSASWLCPLCFWHVFRERWRAFSNILGAISATGGEGIATKYLSNGTVTFESRSSVMPSQNVGAKNHREVFQV